MEPQLSRNPTRVRTFVATVFGIAIITYLITRLSWPEALRTLSTADLGLLFAAVALGMTTTTVRVFRFGSFFAPSGRWLGLYGCFAELRLLAYALPFRTGDIAALGLLRQRRLSPPVAETVPAWLVIRLSDLLALFALVLMVLMFDSSSLGLSRGYDGLAIALAATVVVFLAAVWFAKAFQQAGQPREERSKSRISRWISQFRAGLVHIGSARSLTLLAATSSAAWATNLGAHALALLAFDPELGFMPAFLASAVAAAASLLPVRAPLGLGTDDAFLTGILVLLGEPTTSAIALAFGVRLFQMALITIDWSVGLMLSARDRDYS